MSHQSCQCCGWSKKTTYQGLRIHQGKKGCTPKGMRIPESEQFRFSGHLPQLSYEEPHIEADKDFMNMFPPAVQLNTWGSSWDSSPEMNLFNSTTSIKTENLPVTPNLTALLAAEDAVIAAIEALKPPMRTQDPYRPPREFDFAQSPPLQNFTTRADPAAVEVTMEQTPPLHTAVPQTTAAAQNNLYLNAHRALDFTSGAQPSLWPPFQTFTTRADPAAGEVTMEQIPPLHAAALQTILNTQGALNFTTCAQPSLWPPLQTFTPRANPAAVEVKMEPTNTLAFQTPPLHTTSPKTTGNARRALDFTPCAQQVEQQLGQLPTTTAQDTVNQREREKETEREKEREPQKLQRVKQDRMTAELQMNIRAREQKMADVKTSAQVCKGDLDTEWLEINGVFSKLMKVVEDARQKALRPVEERRKRLKVEAQDTVRKLQKKIDDLKMTLDELQTDPDLKVSPQSCDCTNDAVDSSFSFGTLRTITSIMMKEIQQELEKLSSVELKRIPSFAVDVELDPTTAHPSLVLSPDGKSVRDGGKNQKVPDGPQRFDAYGSILGLGRLTSGKSYWEVEVSNKAGWDLGVARCDAKRKGPLPLNPDGGYWVTVHYEDKKYAALAAPPVSLSLAKKPHKVGVFVDYEEGLVSFYDVGAKSHIYSFTECSFSGGVFPYFSPHLKQIKNSHPLIISAV